MPDSALTGAHAGGRAFVIHGALSRLAACARGVGDPSRSQRDVVEQLTGVLAAGESLVIELHDGKCAVDGAVVAGDEEQTRGWARALCDQGLRAVFIEQEAHPDELLSLAVLLSHPWGSDEQDLGSAAWGVGFRRIHLDIEGRRVIEDIAESDDLDVVDRLLRMVEPDLSFEEEQLLATLTLLRETERGPLHASELLDGHQRAPRDRVLTASLDEVAAGQDVSGGRLGMLFFEAVRNDPDPDSAVLTVRWMLTEVRELLAEGRPGEGLALLRRTLLVMDSDVFPRWEGRVLVDEELQQVHRLQFREAVLSGLHRSPEDPAWQGAIFTLSMATATRELDSLVTFGAVLPTRPLRQAVADALVLLLDRVDHHIRELVHRGTPETLPVLLLAAMRRPDPTLIERFEAWAGAEQAAVREAALVALRPHQAPRIKQVMRAALEDAALPVRVEALRYLAVHKDVESIGIFKAHLQDCTGQPCEPAEIEALCKAWVLIDGAGALPELSALARGQRAGASLHAREAAVSGLWGAGRPGRAAVDELGRTCPELRPRIRALRGAQR